MAVQVLLTPVVASAGHEIPTGVKIYKWVGLTEGNTGDPLQCGQYSDIVVTLSATTVSTATITMQGTLDPDPATVDWHDLHMVDGTTEISINSTTPTISIFQVLEAPVQIRPIGAGTDLVASAWVKLGTSARR